MLEIIQLNNYRIVHLTDGKLIKEAVSLINNKKVDGINFNFVKNFPSDINEIRVAPLTKCIYLHDYSWEFDYSAINYLSNLEQLSILNSDKKEIDFSLFPALKSVSIFWRPKANSLYRCINLESLFLGKYTEPDLSKLEFLKKLEYLRINTGSIKSLKGIESFLELKILMLMQATKLEELNGIEKLTKLSRLRIDNCRNIKNIDIVTTLKKLTSLEIRGTTPRPKFNKN